MARLDTYMDRGDAGPVRSVHPCSSTYVTYTQRCPCHLGAASFPPLFSAVDEALPCGYNQLAVRTRTRHSRGTAIVASTWFEYLQKAGIFQ
jgi:hypothetical protein